LEAKNNSGETALMIASEKNYYDITELLCASGVDLKSKNIRNQTAKDIALYYENQDIADLMKKYEDLGIQKEVKEEVKEIKTKKSFGKILLESAIKILGNKVLNKLLLVIFGI